MMGKAKDQKRSQRRVSVSGLIGWILFDWANNAFPTLIQTFLFASYFTGKVAPDETTGTTWWGNAIGVAGVLVALGAPFLGAMVDQLGRRKPWIAGLIWFTAVAAALLWFIRPSPEYVWPAVLLVGVATMSFELALVLYNAMLRFLARPEEVGRFSGWGWAAGFAGGLACLTVALLVFVRPKGEWLGLDAGAQEHVRATFLLVAGWLVVFSLPLLVFTKDTESTGKSVRKAARDAVRQLQDSVRQVRRYRHIVRFLIARMIYVDGLATVFAFAGVYAGGTFGMDEQEILLFAIAMNVTAGLGAFGFAWVDDWIGGKRTILISLLGLIVPGVVILLVPTTTLFWTFSLILGIFVGPVQAASRSYLARIAPDHLENQVFGLYAFSGKATAFVGPLLVGWLTWLSQSQRVGMSTVVVFFVIGFLLLRTLPEPHVEDGSKRDGESTRE